MLCKQSVHSVKLADDSERRSCLTLADAQPLLPAGALLGLTDQAFCIIDCRGPCKRRLREAGVPEQLPTCF